MTNALSEVGEFFNAWTIYRKVLTNNYMHHKEIYQAVSGLLVGQWAARPFKMIDLGCGDASFLAQALQGTAIQHYTGYDLSGPALMLAAENISSLGCPAEFVNTDFMEGLAQSKERSDIVFTSYALHHLTREEKAEFFRLAHSVLTENGMLLLIDVMREPDETLPVYLDNYCQWLQEEWLQCAEQDIAAITQHIRHNDMPETAASLCALAEAANFFNATNLFQSTWHQAFTFNKKAA